MPGIQSLKDMTFDDFKALVKNGPKIEEDDITDLLRSVGYSDEEIQAIHRNA